MPVLCSLNLSFFLIKNRQLVPGTPGNVSTTLQQIQARNQQTLVSCWSHLVSSASLLKVCANIPGVLFYQDIKSEGNMGVPQRSLPMDPSSLYSQGIIQPKPGLGGAGVPFPHVMSSSYVAKASSLL